MSGIAASNTIITGAAAGIGRAIAARAAQAGARVVLGDVDVDGLEETARQVRDAGAEVAWLRCDARQTTQIDELVQLCRQRFGEPDVLFANAGIEGHLAEPWEIDEAEFRNVLDVNVLGI